MKKNLVLLGMMGVGKSTLGITVSNKQGMEFIDTDLAIEKKCSMKISEIFDKKGEGFFRLEEEKIVLKVLKRNNCVVALGGGTFLNKTVRDYILKNNVSIWLDNKLETLHRRTAWNKKRPLLETKNSLQKINILYAERKNIYKMANYKIKCDGLSKKDIVKKIISIYEKN